MTYYKQIRACSDPEAAALTRERPRLFWAVPAAYESRPEEVYKACALAALEGLALDAGHNFPKKSCGNAGWDAHHITKRIFEEQSVFDPYADKPFCAAATRFCQYYVLRYTAPDMLEKASDFTLDQFAACFCSDGVLHLRKRGCDFRDGAGCGGSDLQNYRLYLAYCNKEGRYISGDVCMGVRRENKWGREAPEAYGLRTDLQREEESGTFAYNVPGYTQLSYDYTRASVLRLINSDSAVRYDRVEIVG